MNISFSVLSMVVLFSCLSACSSDDDNPAPGSSVVGTFAGNIQVSDDPQTDLGYIYNAKVTLTVSGSTAVVKVVGDLGVNREYTGTVTTQSSGTYDVNLEKQTKPSEKIAGDRVVILNNKLTIMIDVANDAVEVKNTPTSTDAKTISGKLQMIGTDMLKE